jgi:hypothetical protein
MATGVFFHNADKEKKSHTQTDGINHDVISSKLRREVVCQVAFYVVFSIRDADDA